LVKDRALFTEARGFCLRTQGDAEKAAAFRRGLGDIADLPVVQASKFELIINAPRATRPRRRGD